MCVCVCRREGLQAVNQNAKKCKPIGTTSKASMTTTARNDSSRPHPASARSFGRARKRRAGGRDGGNRRRSQETPHRPTLKFTTCRRGFRWRRRASCEWHRLLGCLQRHSGLRTRPRPREGGRRREESTGLSLCASEPPPCPLPLARSAPPSPSPPSAQPTLPGLLTHSPLRACARAPATPLHRRCPLRASERTGHLATEARDRLPAQAPVHAFRLGEGGAGIRPGG